MFLRSTSRKKNGKEHRYWSIVENKRCAGGKVVQRHVFYLGEINDQQQTAWQKSLEIYEHGQTQSRTVAWFAEDRVVEEVPDCDIVRIRLSELQLRRPRPWGACWLFCHAYSQLGLDQFWAQRWPPSRKGTRWDLVLQTLCAYRLIDPGSEWRLHRQWFEQSARADLLGEDLSLADRHKLYECHDFLWEHKAALFDHWTERWKDLFNAKFDGLLYDLTSPYFESEPPFPEEDKRKFGYSRDKRPDCVPVVLGLIVTPEGFPLAYEGLAGNTSDQKTLKSFLEEIEKPYGKAQRIWLMDRGVPTEATLQEMQASDPPVLYLVGTPKGRLGQLEGQLAEVSWEKAREAVEVKLLPKEKEVDVLAKSLERRKTDRAIRRRPLKKLWHRLGELKPMKLKRDTLLMRLGAARQAAPAAWRLVKIPLPSRGQKLAFALRKDKLREVRRREGQYLLRSNRTDRAPAQLWEFYLLLVQVEQAFKHLKGDLSIRPIFHQQQERIEAHIFVAFLACCVQASLGRRLKDLAPGLSVRSVLEKMAQMQMIDVHLPTTDGREVILSRYTQPEAEQKLLLEPLRLTLPSQPPPKITAKQLEKK